MIMYDNMLVIYLLSFKIRYYFFIKTIKCNQDKYIKAYTCLLKEKKGGSLAKVENRIIQ